MITVSQVERSSAKNGHILTISAHASVAAAAKGMTRHGIGCLVVMDTNLRVMGILTERDIMSKVVAASADPAKTTVTEVMTMKVISCSMDTEIEQAMQIMGQHGTRHLPIIEGEKVCGMISSRDILAYRLTTADALVRDQSKLLAKLERQYPGITRLEKDPVGRLLL